MGRGTATFDGMSLAQAILEYTHDRIGCKTLFSTHYHELTNLEKTLKHLKNKHVSATEDNDNLVFLHKVKDGSIDKSYGINVAKLAGLPSEVITRASEILTKYEKCIHETIKFMDKYQFNNAGATIYEFTWNNFCDTQSIALFKILKISIIKYLYCTYFTKHIFIHYFFCATEKALHWLRVRAATYDEAGYHVSFEISLYIFIDIKLETIIWTG